MCFLHVAHAKDTKIRKELCQQDFGAFNTCFSDCSTIVVLLLLRSARTNPSISIIQQFQLCNLLVIPTDIVLVEFWHIICSVCFLMTNSLLFCNPPMFLKSKCLVCYLSYLLIQTKGPVGPILPSVT